tara:strand:+ start:358 stop:516 length:159 start_codon:yes stop_codon:yes gene_type:complete
MVERYKNIKIKLHQWNAFANWYKSEFGENLTDEDIEALFKNIMLQDMSGLFM